MPSRGQPEPKQCLDDGGRGAADRREVTDDERGPPTEPFQALLKYAPELPGYPRERAPGRWSRSPSGRGPYRPWAIGPGPHFHQTISESFYILSGSVRSYDGNRWIDTVPGEFVHVPAGGIPGFRNESGEPASMLLHFAPGALREGHFEGLLTLGERTEERAEFFIRHDNHRL